MTLPLFKLTGHKARVTDLCFSADGKLLASSSDDGTTRLWDVGERMELATFRDGEKTVSGVVFTPDAKVLLSLTLDNPAVILAWDVAAEKALGRIDDAHPAGGERIAMSPDGSVFATADWNGLVKVWDVGTRACKFTLEGLGRCARGLAFSADGKYLAASHKEALAMWLVSRGKPRAAPQLPPNSEAAGVAFSPDNAWLAVAQSEYSSGHAQQYDVAGGEARAGFSPPVMMGYSVAYSPDGNLLAYNGGQDKAVLFDSATGAVRGEMEGVHSSQDRGLVFSPDGKLLALGSFDAILVFSVAKVLGG